MGDYDLSRKVVDTFIFSFYSYSNLRVRMFRSLVEDVFHCSPYILDSMRLCLCFKMSSYGLVSHIFLTL